MSNEVKELIQSFREYTLFTQSLRNLPEKTWNSSIESGKWTIRSIICHIMLWDKYFYEEAIHKIATDKPITLKHLDYDEFNSKAIIYGKTITTEELIEKTITYREKIIGDIEALSEEETNQNYLDGDGKVFNVSQYLKDFIWHDQHHVKPLNEYLETVKP